MTVTLARAPSGGTELIDVAAVCVFQMKFCSARHPAHSVHRRHAKFRRRRRQDSRAPATEKRTVWVEAASAGGASKVAPSTAITADGRSRLLHGAPALDAWQGFQANSFAPSRQGLSSNSRCRRYHRAAVDLSVGITCGFMPTTCFHIGRIRGVRAPRPFLGWALCHAGTREPNPPWASGAARDRLSATLGRCAGDGGDGRAARIAQVSQRSRVLRWKTTAVAPGRQTTDVRQAEGARTGVRGAVLVAVLATVLGGWFWWHVATGGPEVIPLSEASPAASGSTACSGRPGTRLPRPVEAALPAPGRSSSMLPAQWPGPEWWSFRRGAGCTKPSTRQAAAQPPRIRTGSTWPPCWRTARRSLFRARGSGSGGAWAGGGRRAIRKPRAKAAPAHPGGKIDLNTAGVEELGTLPRVGPVLAQRIVDWRKQHGRFKTVQELDAVEGVGPKMLEALLPLVRV